MSIKKNVTTLPKEQFLKPKSFCEFFWRLELYKNYEDLYGIKLHTLDASGLKIGKHSYQFSYSYSSWMRVT